MKSIKPLLLALGLLLCLYAAVRAQTPHAMQPTAGLLHSPPVSTENALFDTP